MSQEKEKRTLITLTQEFLNLLTSSDGKEVDLTKLESDLGVSKRRLYDVTNVLTGIGVVERSGKSKVRWIGGSSNQTQDNQTKMNDYLQRSAEVDRMLNFVDQELANVSSGPDFDELGWVTYDDVFTLGKETNLSLFSLKGPSDLIMQLPEDENGYHHLVCSSNNGGIELVPIS